MLTAGECLGMRLPVDRYNYPEGIAREIDMVGTD